MLFHKIFNFIGHENDLPDDEPLKLIGQNASAMFTYLVDVLRSPESFPNKHINDLMRLTWQLVGNDIVRFAVMNDPKLQTIHFYYEQQGSQIIQCFVVPLDFANRCVQQRIFMMGGMVYNSSLMRDFWNKRHDDELRMDRALSYESEFYRTLTNKEGEFKPNEYQQQVIHRFPNGLEDRFKYQGKSFMDAS